MGRGAWWPGLLVMVLAAPVRAQSITVNPAQPVLGAAVTYTFVPGSSNWYIGSYSWEYRWTGACTTAWGPLTDTGYNRKSCTEV